MKDENPIIQINLSFYLVLYNESKGSEKEIQMQISTKYVPYLENMAMLQI